MQDQDPIEEQPDLEAEKAEESRRDILQSLAEACIGRINESIAWRSQLGVEDEWIEDDEFYQGIDDANRHEHPLHVKRQKPMEGGGSSAPKRRTAKYGSTVFPNITAPFTDAASARVGDMLLPTDQKNWALQPTPIADLSELLDWDKEQRDKKAAIATMPEEQKAVMGDNLPQPQQAPEGLLDVAEPAEVKSAIDQAQKIQDEAAKRCKRGEKRVEDWLAECGFTGHTRQVIDDCARLGTGVMKGPTPVMRESKIWVKVEGVVTSELRQEFAPSSKRISVWDCFPDPNCGDNIHNGDYFSERDYLSEANLKELVAEAELAESTGEASVGGYLIDELKAVIAEGPMLRSGGGVTSIRSPKDDKLQKNESFEVFYYYGIAKAEELIAAGCECEDDAPNAFAILTIINSRVVRAALNPSPKGKFPYDFLPWKQRQGLPFGVGVPRGIRTPQRMVVAATRNLMNNAGFSSGLQIIIRKGGITPKNGKWEITPNKVWEASDDAKDVREAMTAITFPMMVNELNAIIQLGMKMAEDVTGLPMLLQGQQGKAPDTVGGITIMNNNANSVLRRTARSADFYLTSPHITRYYEYLMEYGEDEKEKGDFKVVARGSSALVERDIQNQEMMNLMNLSLNPNYEIDPAKAAEEYLRSRRFDPTAFRFTDEELQKRRSMPPPKSPQVEVAEIRAENAKEIAGLRAQLDMKLDQTDTDRDVVYVQAETERTMKEHEARMTELAVKERIAIANYANQRGINLDKAKAELAKTAMTLRTQKELAQQGPAKQVAKPAFEPPGRAKDGQAFQR